MNTALLNQPVKLSGLGCGCGCNDCGSGMKGLGSIEFNTTPTSDWNCFDWIIWHKALIDAFKAGKFASRIKYSDADAKAKAKEVLITWWDKLNTWYGSNVWCSYSPEFYNYFKNAGITEIIGTLPSLIAPLYSAATKVSQSGGNIIQNAAQGAEDVTGNASSLINNTVKMLKIAVPVIIVGALVAGGFYAYRHYVKPKKK